MLPTAQKKGATGLTNWWTQERIEYYMDDWRRPDYPKPESPLSVGSKTCRYYQHRPAIKITKSTMKPGKKIIIPTNKPHTPRSQEAGFVHKLTVQSCRPVVPGSQRYYNSLTAPQHSHGNLHLPRQLEEYRKKKGRIPLSICTSFKGYDVISTGDIITKPTSTRLQELHNYQVIHHQPKRPQHWLQH